MFTRFARSLCFFRQEASGSIAISFALLAIPMMCVIGGAFDMSMVMQKQQMAQDAVGSAASKAVVMLQARASEADIKQTAQAEIMRLQAEGKAPTGTYQVSINPKGRYVEISGTAKTRTNFLSLIGFGEMQYTATSRKFHEGHRVAVRYGDTKVSDEHRDELIELVTAIRAGDTTRMAELRALLADMRNNY